MRGCVCACVYMCVEKCSNCILEGRVEDTGGCPNCELNYILLWSVHGAMWPLYDLCGRETCGLVTFSCPCYFWAVWSLVRKKKRKQLLDLLACVSWRDYYWWIVGSVTIDSGAVRSCWETAAIQWILQAPLFMCLRSRLLFLDSVSVGYECRDVNDSVLCTGF